VIITKYFNTEKNVKDYQSGSFKLGTLGGYRNQEGAENIFERMSDKGEGISERIYGGSSGQIDRMISGAMVFEQMSWSNCGDGISLVDEVNDYVFCASIGSYDREHHSRILFGNESVGYKGNPDLDAYAEIDLEIFLRGLRSWLTQSGNISANREWMPRLVYAKPVTYGDRITRRDIPDSLSVNHQIDEELYFSAVFNKPSRFQTEREVRVVARCKFPLYLPAGSPALFPKSQELRNSIVQMGVWK
jgi:hypothetical protein